MMKALTSEDFLRVLDLPPKVGEEMLYFSLVLEMGKPATLCCVVVQISKQLSKTYYADVRSGEDLVWIPSEDYTPPREPVENVHIAILSRLGLWDQAHRLLFQRVDFYGSAGELVHTTIKGILVETK